MTKFENNLYEGSVLKRLVLFSLPFLASNIIQSLYNVADMLIVGNFSGTNSLSGVNIGGQVTFILTQIVLGFCIGGSVLIAQYIGAQNKRAVEKVTSTLITSLLILSAIITVLMVVLRTPVLRLVKTPQESFSEANAYLFITVLGIIFIFAYNALSAILRGMGDSKRPLYFIAVACVTNVVLDLLLVAKFNMGAAGAAIATVISQAISVILCIVYLKKNDFIFDFKPSSFRIDRESLRLITKLGLPTAVQNGVTSLSFMFITVLVNMVGGVNASAAVGVVSRFNGFAVMPAVAMASSVSTMAAQNIGAGQIDRAKKTCRIGVIVSVFFSYAIFALVQAFPEPILMLFDRNPEMIANGVEYIRVMSLDYLVIPYIFCINSLFVGAGHTTFSLISNMLSSLLLRVPAAAIFGITLGGGLAGIAFGAPVASVGSLVLVLWFYFSGKWKKVVIHHQPQEE
ncbi:MAG: MATE family efflux transporter [Clostridiales bacterium]|nr:MATE family efflux transporter [Clostridiales bacterium]